jgi:hypothetical protein
MFEELEENKPREQEPTNYTGLIIFVCTLPVLLFFTHIGKTEMGLSVGICLGMMVLAVGMCWDLRSHLWFWMIIVFLLALHVPLILMIQWPHWWVSKIALLPIGLADLLIDVGTVRFVEKFIVKAAPADREA